jgi:excisionase family DNA binding protein
MDYFSVCTKYTGIGRSVMSDDNTEIECGTVKAWPDAGRRLGLGRNATYDAIARGEIPVIRFGRRIVVPKRALDRMLNGDMA